MNSLMVAILLASVCAGSASAGPANANSSGPSVAETLVRVQLVNALKQLEQDLGDAMVAADTARINEIFADDWQSVGRSGKITTKQSMVRNFKDGKDKLESFVLTPMDVQVFGNVAVIHGGVIEKRSYEGKDTSGELVWMDLLEKRGDKWVIIRSAGARVKLETAPDGPAHRMPLIFRP